MTAAAPSDVTRWIKRFDGRRSTPPAARLFCFHHAGGAASGFRYWPRALPPTVEVMAVQLPGRADRLREQPYTAMPDLVDALVERLQNLLDIPFAFFGLSMGAKVCWTLAHRLRELGLPGPVALYLAGAASPGWPEGRVDWAVPDDEMIAYLREMGGTPPEVFEHPALLTVLLQTLRADLTLVDSSWFVAAEIFDVPILAFAGTEDVEGGPERMAGWGAQTRGSFALTEVPGGHFFDEAGEALMLDHIAAGLAQTLALPGLHP
jgi:medium-chain acyl-[acyl-carrier-protein] hydrolase